jgi:hypothetical protein
VTVLPNSSSLLILAAFTPSIETHGMGVDSLEAVYSMGSTVNVGDVLERMRPIPPAFTTVMVWL